MYPILQEVPVFFTGTRLIKDVFISPACDQRISGKNTFCAHTTEKHALDTTDSYDNYRKFKDILLQPGLGHIEINMVKACFKLLWGVFLNIWGQCWDLEVSKLNYLVRHHKSMHILEITLLATADELLVVYCKEQWLRGVTVSASHFLEW